MDHQIIGSCPFTLQYMAYLESQQMLKLVAKSLETAQVALEMDLVKLQFKQIDMQLPEVSFVKGKWKVAVDLGKKSPYNFK